MKFHVTRVQEEQWKNGQPLTFTELDVGYHEFLGIDQALPGPRPGPNNKKPCSLCVRATRPDGSTAELLASIVTSDQTLRHGMLGFYRRRAPEIPVGTEIELLGYESSPI
jgi:hypothetical protein